jgi:hypothetical protein
LVLNILLDNSSGTFWTTWSASTQPLGVLIMYVALEATSDNFSFLPQLKLMKSCDAPESNRIII